MNDDRIGLIHDILFQKADNLVQAVYNLTYAFP